MLKLCLKAAAKIAAFFNFAVDGSFAMLFHIARREFVSNILTARFAVGFILCLFLFPSSAVILTSDYEGRLNKYRESAIQKLWITSEA